MTAEAPRIRLGWEEWLGLPDLGLPALRAKVDTGAKTSALHASGIEAHAQDGAVRVRFTVAPNPSRPGVVVTCEAPVIDRREVTSSNGTSEWRYVIETTLDVGGGSWPIEVTLTDRATMSARMLLGRQALTERVVVDPTTRFVQPKRRFATTPATEPPVAVPSRPLRIAILSREPGTYSTTRLAAEGRLRGHQVDVIDTARCYMTISALAPEVHYDGARLPHYDAVIPRIGASITPYGTALVRQFESLGTHCVNGSAGITASRDKLHAHQVLARHQIGMPVTAFASSPKDTDNLISLVGNAPLIVKLLESSQGRGVVLAETNKAAQSVISAFRGLRANFLVQHFVAEAAGEDIRCFVIAGRVMAAMRRTASGDDFRSNLHLGGVAETVRITPAERDAAVRAARAFGLGLAGVDLLRAHDGPKVLEVNSSPGFEGIEKASGQNLAAKVYAEIERKQQLGRISRA